MQYFQLEGTTFHRVVRLFFFMKNPNEEDAPLESHPVAIRVTETVVEYTADIVFGVVEFAEFAMFYTAGSQMIPMRVANPGSRQPLIGGGVQEMRMEIEGAIARILNEVYEEHPTIAFKDEDGNPLREMSDEDLHDAYNRAQISSAPAEHRVERAVTSIDPEVWAKLTPEQQRMIRPSGAQPLPNGQDGASGGVVPPVVGAVAAAVTPLPSPTTGAQGAVPVTGGPVAAPISTSGLEAQ